MQAVDGCHRSQAHDRRKAVEQRQGLGCWHFGTWHLHKPEYFWLISGSAIAHGMMGLVRNLSILSALWMSSRSPWVMYEKAVCSRQRQLQRVPKAGALGLVGGPRGWPSVQEARLGSGCGLQRETEWQQLWKTAGHWAVWPGPVTTPGRGQ